jgi:F0F1-type ATP synthase assembly protein I
MVEFILFLHVFGAVAAGYYMLLPFLMLRLDKLSKPAEEGYVNALFIANRIGQYILIAQFITGGYLISKGSYTVTWIVVSILLFVAIAALAGIMGKAMKRFTAGSKEGRETKADASKMKKLSVYIGILFAILVFVMYYSHII